MRVSFTESLDKILKANTLRPAVLLRVVPIAVAALTSQSIVLKTDFPAKHRNPVVAKVCSCLKLGSSIGLGFFNLTSLLRRLDVTSFCMQ